MSIKLRVSILGGFVLIASVLLSSYAAYGWEMIPNRGVLKFPRMEAIGHISKEKMTDVGKIISVEHELSDFVGEGEIVYINIGEEAGVHEGEEFRIFRNIRIREPKIGYLVAWVGRLKVLTVEKGFSKAVIVKDFRAINIGDSLAKFDPNDPKLSTEIKLKRRTSPLDGHILMVDENRAFFGKGDVIYFNRGFRDGVEVGNCFVIYRLPGQGIVGLLETMQDVSRKKDQQAAPSMIINVGEMVVLSAQQTNATSLVIKGKVPMTRGERFTTVPCGWEHMEVESEEELVKEEETVAALPKEEPPTEEVEKIQEPEAEVKAFPEKDVNFDFDRYNLTEEAREILGEKAAWLKTNPDIKVLIEGHCDERGTNAYNLALGERRAAAVEQYLIELGIAKERLSTISYGEEMPLDPDSSEAAWTKNRRAHFVIETE
jgi:peptidoglycan-associated lipoprotein